MLCYIPNARMRRHLTPIPPTSWFPRKCLCHLPSLLAVMEIEMRCAKLFNNPNLLDSQTEQSVQTFQISVVQRLLIGETNLLSLPDVACRSIRISFERN
jgi:hypothetical protein